MDTTKKTEPSGFRFIGSLLEIETANGLRRIEEFGATVDVSKVEGMALIREHNVAMLPAADFDAIGFTKDELERVKYPGGRIDPSPEIAAKLKVARVRLHEVREGK